MSESPELLKKSLLLETDIFSADYDDPEDRETATLTEATRVPALSESPCALAEAAPLPNTDANTELEGAVDLFNMAMSIEASQKPIDAVRRAKAEFSAYMAERDTPKPDAFSLYSESNVFYRKRHLRKTASLSAPPKSQFTPFSFHQTCQRGEVKTTRQNSTLSRLHRDKGVSGQTLLKNDRTLSIRTSSTFAHAKRQPASHALFSQHRQTPSRIKGPREEKKAICPPVHRKTSHKQPARLYSASNSMGPLRLTRLTLRLSEEKESAQGRQSMKMPMSF